MAKDEDLHTKVQFKQLWWEGTNLHYITEDDRHVVLTNCTIHRTVYEIEDSQGIQYHEEQMQFHAKGKLELTN